ncbi:MAG: hypothetical protein D6753_18285 [Planctomycetota bacterium]|nr:MAG: hypothetical protein D6753_18285 [Planctomycetota bacterium]
MGRGSVASAIAVSAHFFLPSLSGPDSAIEHLLQVPANCTGHQAMTVAQLKILHEVITLYVFVAYTSLSLPHCSTCGTRSPGDCLWAGLCL